MISVQYMVIDDAMTCSNCRR